MRTLLAVAICLVLSSIRAFGQCPTIVWSDEFDQAQVDDSKWSFQPGDGCADGLCGWGNQELEWYRAENAIVEGGFLHIVARRESFGGKQYTSARMKTEGKGDWTFGRVEARIKLPKGQGIWPAFWMMPTNPKYGGWPMSGEIDIMEMVGHEPERVQGTIHFGNRQSRSDGYSLQRGDFADDFHEFAVEREPGTIRWYVDGYLFHEVTAADIEPEFWPFDESFHVLLNVAVGGQWPGNPDGTTVFPDSMSVDYVRVYDGRRASLHGPREVFHGSTSTYEIADLPADGTVQWYVPAGASVVEGQGTGVVDIRWGTEGGIVRAEVDGSCGEQELAVDVRAGSPFVRDFSLAAFEGDDRAARGPRTSGSLSVVANPTPSDLNPSANSGRYVRNAGVQYDVLYLETEGDFDAASFVSGERQFQMHLNSSAPAGTEIILQLENGSLSSGPYPQGRHSRFRGLTGEPGTWQEIVFEFLDRPHNGLDPSGVGSIVLLFAPNSYTGHTYHIDNFDAYVRSDGLGLSTEHPLSSEEGLTRLIAYPNPAASALNLEFELPAADLVSMTLYDVMGREVRSVLSGPRSTGSHRVDVAVHDLASGVYVAVLQTSTNTIPQLVIISR